MIRLFKFASIAARRVPMTKQSFLKRQFQMFSPVKSSIKNETRNLTREKIDGDVKDIESIGNLVLKEGK